ncbi:hypothetical protein JG687_00014399 [Phytophthora cactorum]|uniref:Uncharacterized protein n=1 Tax=Phytophthora cactorum TaxID=29920 RepID=A0A329RG15_9STRA|nr:hypothetical protein GQ600_20049 [Phytophthora cactorum]KAG2785428.1 hypothetical protein Pcac1_g4963 [Phytophthora cactorum]KAG2827005.1 hypothetical protein PC111_g8749 [Phytophthora cactorum]KAG2896645.1 hypothetical protein PC114_g15000 [Phytophthora cactorum]KAG2927442.1 hypothetical protein PC117_g14570 [Phytophthora cactorum]
METASKVNKATLQKLKFAVWKYLLRRTQLQAQKKLGMELMEREAYSDKNHDELMDYFKYYSKGPLKYD